VTIKESLLGTKSILSRSWHLEDFYILRFYNIKVNLSRDTVKMFMSQAIFSIWRHQ